MTEVKKYCDFCKCEETKSELGHGELYEITLPKELNGSWKYSYFREKDICGNCLEKVLSSLDIKMEKK